MKTSALMRFVITASCALVFAAPAPVHAQRTPPARPPSLASIDSLLSRSRFREATAALDAWDRALTTKVPAADRAAALMMRARMAGQGDKARDLYFEISSSYPSSREAAVALLRLAQLAVAENDTLRAVAHFQRVARDYPTADAAADAREWLAKLSPTTPTRNAQQPAPSTDATTSRTPPKPAQSSAPVSAPTSASTPAAARDTKAGAKDGPFALQIAAFREPSTAVTVAKKLTQRGFDARVVTVPGSTLSRVRIGRFPTSKATDDLLRRLRAAGYEAVVVDDAAKEITSSR